MVMPIEMPADSPAKTRSGLTTLMQNIGLPSSQFNKWVPQLHSNLLQQADQFRSLAGPTWNEFLVAALKMNTRSKSFHRTHVVVIYAKFGFGLGEIQSLDYFQVWKIDDLMTYGLKKFGLPPDTIEHYRTHELNLSSSRPMPPDASPDTVYLPVVYRVGDVFRQKVWVEPNYIKYAGPPKSCLSNSKSEKLTSKNFQKIKKLVAEAAVPVTSPKL